MNKNKAFSIPVKGLSNVFENTSITFDGTGMEITVSLNIEPEMRQYLRSDHIFKGTYYIYKVRKHIPSKYIDSYTVQRVHDHLLNNCMRICREAKMKVIERELKDLKKQHVQTKLNF